MKERLHPVYYYNIKKQTKARIWDALMKDIIEWGFSKDIEWNFYKEIRGITEFCRYIGIWTNTLWKYLSGNIMETEERIKNEKSIYLWHNEIMIIREWIALRERYSKLCNREKKVAQYILLSIWKNL